ncbi:MAG TPA: ABC transporter substrate-binding protein, partial [Stellaceae bacterium]|nr:ABC transporter substrate-binding protein [Stellaceae bacterium]
YLNYAAVDPGLTNDKCSFWHFRFDSDVNMKMQAMTEYLVKDKHIKNVYLFNPDYSFGQSVQKAAETMLGAKDPEVKILGHELVPLGKVKDFAPYVAKIQASGADSVITGNWGNDISLLIKAAVDGGYKGTFYTYYGGTLGTPTALGKAGSGLIQVTEWHNNIPSPEMDQLIAEFEKKYNADFYFYHNKTMMSMLTEAMRTSHSTDPLKVALALEDMEFTTDFGPVHMRKDNHQLVQPLYVSVFTEGMKHDMEHTGLGFKTLARIEAKDTDTPTTCQMSRPTS